ncbi:hypothetical protein [Kitasatospora sp. NPDC057198]|uniref:hypothetical protein n=1 Tax=Kitasatospora sp. NPDC057198 TaxID=3346046 RepID=UPI00362E5921
MEALGGFIKCYLNVEVAYDGLMPRVRSTIRMSTPEWGEAIRRELEQALSERPYSVVDYLQMTWIEFESEDALYAYLERVFHYLFAGGEEVPLPPED